MPDINISVQNKIAVQTNKTEYICDNSDFIIKFNFDAEWDAYDSKTARFCYNSKYVDIVFTGDSCAIPIISDTNDISIGVYAGNLHTTTPALVLCEKSILGGSGFPADPPDDVYNQIMELIQGLGTPDAEAIAKAVADYLIKNPLEETDPTVPEWAKAENKPTYTAAEVGAIANTELQFDGAKGDPGKAATIQVGKVTTGAAGTPASVFNVGTDESAIFDFTIPQGEKGEDAAADPTLGLTGATVGQIAKIATVDASGVPTAWSPVDMPSAGGNSNNFEKVVEMTTLEDTAVISISTDKNDNHLSMSEFYVAITTARNNAATANNYFNCNVLPDTVPVHTRTISAIKSLSLFQDVYCYVMHYKVVGGMIFNEYVGRQRTKNGLNSAEYLENEKSLGISASSGETIGFMSPPDATSGESKIDASGKMYCITFSADSTGCIFGAGTRVEVWAK